MHGLGFLYISIQKRNERMDPHTHGDSLINCVGNTNQNKIDGVHESHQNPFKGGSYNHFQPVQLSECLVL